MRRSEKEIKDKEILKSLLGKAKICRIALSEDNKPYIIPMNFGFKDDCLYLHSANKGRKIEILRKNNHICFEIDLKTELIKAPEPCNWSMRYYSVIGFGKAAFIENIKGKIEALDLIMAKYAPDQTFEYQKSMVDDLVILKVQITELTGKKSGY